MIHLRTLLFRIGQIATLFPFCIIALIALPLPATIRSKVIGGWAKFITWWLKVTCNLSHTVTGLSNLPTKPCVLASNHQSDWDSIGPQSFLPPLAWVLKQELLRIPVFGWGLWATRPISINRQQSMNALNQIISQGKKKLAEGRFILIFPEGTRSRYGTSGNYKRGVVKLARSTESTIVPIAHNAGKFWPKGSRLIHPGVIECRIGQAIELADKTDREVINEIQAWIELQGL